MRLYRRLRESDSAYVHSKNGVVQTVKKKAVFHAPKYAIPEHLIRYLRGVSDTP
jgi:hypothetical protein